jgi:hypothetical protein
MRMPRLSIEMSTPSGALAPDFGPSMRIAGSRGGAGGCGARGTAARRGGSRVSGSASTRSVMRQVNGGRSCRMPTATSSSADSSQKRVQLMLTSQLA